MNKLYYDLEIKILFLAKEDVIRTSPNQFDDVQEDIFTPRSEGNITFG